MVFRDNLSSELSEESLVSLLEGDVILVRFWNKEFRILDGTLRVLFL